MDSRTREILRLREVVKLAIEEIVDWNHSEICGSICSCEGYRKELQSKFPVQPIKKKEE